MPCGPGGAVRVARSVPGVLRHATAGRRPARAGSRHLLPTSAMVSRITARCRHGPRRDNASASRSGLVRRCWQPASRMARLRASGPGSLAASTRLRAIRVRGGSPIGLTSRGESSVDQCSRTSHSGCGDVDEPGTTIVVWSSGKPSSRSYAAAVSPPRTAPGGPAASATRCISSRLSGPLCRTTTPSAGDCHRRALSWARTCEAVVLRQAASRVSTVGPSSSPGEPGPQRAPLAVAAAAAGDDGRLWMTDLPASQSSGRSYGRKIGGRIFRRGGRRDARTAGRWAGGSSGEAVVGALVRPEDRGWASAGRAQMFRRGGRRGARTAGRSGGGAGGFGLEPEPGGGGDEQRGAEQVQGDEHQRAGRWRTAPARRCPARPRRRAAARPPARPPAEPPRHATRTGSPLSARPAGRPGRRGPG